MPSFPPFGVQPGYATQLDPMAEFQFRDWVQKNNVPFNPDAQGPTDYDMRGYYQGLMNGNPMAQPTEINPNDNRPHYTDYYKTPLHQTFSAGSQWAGEGAPQWANDSQLAAPNGRVLFDEKLGGPPTDPVLLAKILLSK
jgi:hypothetical protein